MKINTKKLAAGPVMAAALLCAVSVGVNAPGVSNVYAATVTESTDTTRTKRPERGTKTGENGEKPEQKGTRYVGKITSLTSSAITVELGEMKQREKPANGTDAAKESTKEKEDRDPEDFITLTGETKTITITDSTRFRSRGKRFDFPVMIGSHFDDAVFVLRFEPEEILRASPGSILDSLRNRLPSKAIAPTVRTPSGTA